MQPTTTSTSPTNSLGSPIQIASNTMMVTASLSPLVNQQQNGSVARHFFTQQWPENVGVLAMEVYFPKKFVDQNDLEKHDGVSTGKYTIGLGQSKMAFCDDREDINSICLTVVHNLLEKYGVPPSSIGRLEVGTETIIDKSKSVKSVLMQLFQTLDTTTPGGNTSIEGIDTKNACYGGTNALFNAVQWVESSAWDGRYALVVAGDIAVYQSGSARPTGGAGVVAMLIGKDAPIVMDRGLRGTHMEHAWDFYKPDLSSEFPEVDGPLTISCYLKALDMCYSRYITKLEALEQCLHPETSNPRIRILEKVDYAVFHSPFTKLVQKSFARLALNDFLRVVNEATNGATEEVRQIATHELDTTYASVIKFRDVKLEESYFNKDVEKAFLDFTKKVFLEKVEPSLLLAKNLGNMYCGSVYGCFSSLISEIDPSLLANKRVLVFSYGSGMASSLFSFTFRTTPDYISDSLRLSNRLETRRCMQPEQFEKVMALREHTHNLRDYAPVSDVEDLFPGTYYLEKVDDKFRRSYARRV